MCCFWIATHYFTPGSEFSSVAFERTKMPHGIIFTRQIKKTTLFRKPKQWRGLWWRDRRCKRKVSPRRGNFLFFPFNFALLLTWQYTHNCFGAFGTFDFFHLFLSISDSNEISTFKVICNPAFSILMNWCSHDFTLSHHRVHLRAKYKNYLFLSLDSMSPLIKLM